MNCKVAGRIIHESFSTSEQSTLRNNSSAHLAFESFLLSNGTKLVTRIPNKKPESTFKKSRSRDGIELATWRSGSSVATTLLDYTLVSMSIQTWVVVRSKERIFTIKSFRYRSKGLDFVAARAV